MQGLFFVRPRLPLENFGTRQGAEFIRFLPVKGGFSRKMYCLRQLL
jgi:hypothetical protein